MGTPKKQPEVRRLRGSDARSFRPLLIEALIVHPDCFLDDYTIELERPMKDTEADLEQSGTFGAWLGEELVGIAA